MVLIVSVPKSQPHLTLGTKAKPKAVSSVLFLLSTEDRKQATASGSAAQPPRFTASVRVPRRRSLASQPHMRSLRVAAPHARAHACCPVCPAKCSRSALQNAIKATPRALVPRLEPQVLGPPHFNCTSQPSLSAAARASNPHLHDVTVQNTMHLFWGRAGEEENSEQPLALRTPAG